MKQSTLIDQQFGSVASAYLTSTVHASGADLDVLKEMAQRYQRPHVLDLGCGAGHVSFVMAPFSASVIAYDLSQSMLDVVQTSATNRNLHNIETRAGEAEHLPFEDNSFDIIVTRFSAHHWRDVSTALQEIYRVLRQAGVAIVIDITASEDALYDTTLQAVELLRDASHVRDYRESEWAMMFAGAGFRHATMDRWRLKMVFDDWIARMRTPQERVIAIRSLLDSASDETRSHFCIQADYSFFIDAAMFELKKQPYCKE